MKNIALLGSTGSVGKNVASVVRSFPDRFRLVALSSNNNVGSLAEQVEEFSPKAAAVGNEKAFSSFSGRIPGKTSVLSGEEALEQLASMPEADMIFIAISGMAALKPLIAALKSGKSVALASKEPIVSAGEIVRKIAEEHSASIIPVDSEHSAIMQCLAGRSHQEVRTLYITGTGGPLRNRDQFSSVSMEEVLTHPKWDMGRKITVDSATLMNKGLEVIEARWLFDVPAGRIKVVIHPEAVVHSMVEFTDGTVNACLFSPDMRFPILKALSYPEMLSNDFPRLDFSAIGNLTFSEPDIERFPALELAYRAIEEGGTCPAVLNGANEAAVRMFLEGKLEFIDIINKVSDVMRGHGKIDDPSLDDIINTGKWAFEEVLGSC